MGGRGQQGIIHHIRLGKRTVDPCAGQWQRPDRVERAIEPPQIFEAHEADCEREQAPRHAAIDPVVAIGHQQLRLRQHASSLFFIRRGVRSGLLAGGCTGCLWWRCVVCVAAPRGPPLLAAVAIGRDLRQAFLDGPLVGPLFFGDRHARNVGLICGSILRESDACRAAAELFLRGLLARLFGGENLWRTIDLNAANELRGHYRQREPHGGQPRRGQPGVEPSPRKGTHQQQQGRRR